MKKALALMLLLAALLSGCGQDTVENAPTPPPAPTPVHETVLPPTPTATPEPMPAPTPAPAPLPTPTPMLLTEPKDSYMVKVTDYIPDIAVELRYATENNFTLQRIYAFEDTYLRYGTVKKLMEVQSELRSMGLRLKIWDGFRPVSAQFALWEVCPNAAYVANPNTGYSSHSRGNTLDITLVDAQGAELTMPTGFDDFSALADRDYSDCPEEAAENARLLQSVMEKHGFSGYHAEWWHYTDTAGYDVEYVFDPALLAPRYALCEEFISLRSAPDTSAETLERIPAGGKFSLLGYSGDFSYVEYLGLRGWVLMDYTKESE